MNTIEDANNVDNPIYKLLLNKVAAYLEFAKEKDLDVEVVTTALEYVRDNPKRYKDDVALAMHDALIEWDVIG